MPLIFLLAVLLAAAGPVAGFWYEYIQVTRPLPTDSLVPICTAAVFSNSFANTSSQQPATALYSPPVECPGPWYAVSLELLASCDGPQSSRIAAVWVEGVELLRSSTPKPAGAGGFWVIRKDVTAYSAVLRLENATISVMLDNAIDEVNTGVFQLNISLHFYIGGFYAATEITKNDSKIKAYDEEIPDRASESGVEIQKLTGSGIGQMSYLSHDLNQARVSLSNKPADLIIPISSNGSDGFWFKITNPTNLLAKNVVIPPNTYQAVLEIFVSFHSDDELWYVDPPRLFPSGHGEGAFRRVFAVIDRIYVGSVIPFPVINAEGFNPLFWQPIVGIGALDHPSYKLELTPFLWVLLDGNPHTVQIGVEDADNLWLVDANFHLWLDHNLSQVLANLVQYNAPTPRISRKFKVEKLIDGEFEIKTQYKTQFSGWVSSSFGNLTTHVTSDLRFKNKIKIEGSDNKKEAEQSVSLTTEVSLQPNSEPLSARLKRETKYSFELESSIRPRADFTERVKTELSNEIEDQSTLTLPSGLISNYLKNEQEAEGWMIVKDKSVLDGYTTTEQTYSYSDNTSKFSCTLTARGGVLANNFTDTCATYGQFDENVAAPI